MRFITDLLKIDMLPIFLFLFRLLVSILTYLGQILKRTSDVLILLGIK